MHLTVAQSMAYIATISAGWLMVRAGVAKNQLKIKASRSCPSCGRKRSNNQCPCTQER
jgi:hypothetical protein